MQKERPSHCSEVTAFTPVISVSLPLKPFFTLIVIHCSAVRPEQRNSAKDIDNWHRDRGFRHGIGYHDVIRRDGSIELGRPLEMVGAHVVGHNKHSIGICYEGGYNSKGQADDTRTPEQKVTLRKLLEKLRVQFPKALIVGHHDLNHVKACPCFNAINEYRDLQPQ